MNLEESERINEEVLEAIDIYLFSNGQRHTPPRKYHLCSEDLGSWDHVLDFLKSHHFGDTHRSLRMCSLTGRQLHGPIELSDGAAYVAVPDDQEFVDSGYGSYLNKANRSREKRQAKLSSADLELILTGCDPRCSCQKFLQSVINANQNVKHLVKTSVSNITEAPERIIISDSPAGPNQVRDLIGSILSDDKGGKTNKGANSIIGDKTQNLTNQQSKTAVGITDLQQRQRNSTPIDEQHEFQLKTTASDDLQQRSQSSTTIDHKEQLQPDKTMIDHQQQRKRNSTSSEYQHQFQPYNTPFDDPQQRRNSTSIDDQQKKKWNNNNIGDQYQRKRNSTIESQQEVQQNVKTVDDQPQRKRISAVSDDQHQLLQNRGTVDLQPQLEQNNTSVENAKQLTRPTVPRWRNRPTPPTLPLKKPISPKLDHSDSINNKSKTLTKPNLKTTIQSKTKPSIRFPLRRRPTPANNLHNGPITTAYNTTTDNKVTPISRRDDSQMIHMPQNNNAAIQSKSETPSDDITHEILTVGSLEEDKRSYNDNKVPTTFKTVATSTQDNTGQTRNRDNSQTPVINYVNKEVQMNVEQSSKEIYTTDLPKTVEKMVETDVSATGSDLQPSQSLNDDQPARRKTIDEKITAVTNKDDVVNINLNIFMRKPKDTKPTQSKEGVVVEASVQSLHSFIETEYVKTFRICEGSQKVALVRGGCICQYHERNTPQYVRYDEQLPGPHSTTEKSSSGYLLKKSNPKTSLETLSSKIPEKTQQNADVTFLVDDESKANEKPDSSQIIAHDMPQPEMDNKEYIAPSLASSKSSVVTKEETLVLKAERVINNHLLKATVDKFTQTDWCDVLLEAHHHDDGRYTFHLPPLDHIRHSQLSDATIMESKPKE